MARKIIVGNYNEKYGLDLDPSKSYSKEDVLPIMRQKLEEYEQKVKLIRDFLESYEYANTMNVMATLSPTTKKKLLNLLSEEMKDK